MKKWCTHGSTTHASEMYSNIKDLKDCWVLPPSRPYCVAPYGTAYRRVPRGLPQSSTHTQRGTPRVWISSRPFPDVAMAIALAAKSLLVLVPEVSYCESLSVGDV